MEEVFTLDKILLSINVVEKFYNNYKNEKFKEYLLSVLPEVENCRTQKQDNPWHIYNCLDHILHSVEEMNKLTKGYDLNTRRMLAYTMFLHDIGKPECYIRRFSKLYNKKVDSFFYHNLASEKIAKRVLSKFNFNNQEQSVIELLIHEHDVFIDIKLNSVQNKHQKLLTNDLLNEMADKYNSVGDGQEVLRYLFMVGRADNLAQNPKMTKDSLHMLDVMDNMLENIKNQSACILNKTKKTTKNNL